MLQGLMRLAFGAWKADATRAGGQAGPEEHARCWSKMRGVAGYSML